MPNFQRIPIAFYMALACSQVKFTVASILCMPYIIDILLFQLHKLFDYVNIF